MRCIDMHQETTKRRAESERHIMADARILGILLTTTLLQLPLHAAQTILWKMGEPDRSDHEFTAAPGAHEQGPIVVSIDNRTDMNRWPKFEPGSGNGAYGGQPRRFTLTFQLPDTPPKGVFYLDLSLLFRQPRVPVLELHINGHHGRYYFRPHPMFDLGSVSDEFNPIRSFQRRKLALPAAFFRPGENRLSFIALDEPATVITNRNVGGNGDSGFYYDSLALSYDPEAALNEQFQVNLIPRVFFRKTNTGVREECWLVVRFPRGWAGGKAHIELGKFATDVDVPKPAEFGEARVPFSVPGDAQECAGRVVLSSRAGGPGSIPARNQSFDMKFVPARKWKVFYAPNEHLDIGYTDYRAKVAEVHSRNIDRLLKVFKAHPNYRFNIDGSWIIDQWLDTRSQSQAQQFSAEAKAGRIGVNAFYDSFVTDYPALETFVRSLYFSKQLQARYGVPFDFANITDIPGNSWAVPSLLASAGIRYFADGGNQDRGPLIVYGHWSVRSPFWWQGPDGQRVLTWFSSHYHQLKGVCGLPPNIDDGKGGLARFLRTYSDAHYKPDAVLLYGTEVENLPLECDDPAFVTRWNRRFAYPRFIICRFSRFFRYIQDHYGATLPTVRGGAGAYWGDTFGAFPLATARDRANQMRAISAESLASLTAALNPALRFPLNWDHQIWRNILLYGEHTFGSYRTGSQPLHDEVLGQLNEKANQTVRAATSIDKLMRHGMSQLADQIQTAGQNLIVFNPSNWKRSGLVRFMVAKGATLTDLALHKPVDYEVLNTQNGAQTIRFMAADLPAFGYKVYRLGHGTPHPAAPAVSAPGNVLENQFYRITLDPRHAAIKSVYDKQLGRELVDPSSPYLLDEYLFVSGGGTAKGQGRGSEDSTLLHPYRWLPPPRLTIHQPTHGLLLGVERTPWGQVVRMRASAAHTPNVETEILLPDNLKEIAFNDTIQVGLLYAKEAAYFAFPWAINRPTFRCEIADGFLNPAKDLLEGACSDWFSVQDLVNVSSARGGSVNLAIVDSPLVCLGTIDRGRWPRRFQSPSSTVFSYVMNNYWSSKWEGKKSATLRNHYAITSGPQFDSAGAMRFGRQARQPLEIAELKSSDKLAGASGKLPPGQAGFLDLEPGNLLLTAFKAAEDDHGLAVRVLETAGRQTKGVLKLPFLRVMSAREADAVEAPGAALENDNGGVHFEVRPHQVVTLKLTTENQ
jgi:alpha-mannosidase